MDKKYIYFNLLYFFIILFYFNFKLFYTYEIQVIENINNDNTIQLKLYDGLIKKYFFEKDIFHSLYPYMLENEHIPQRLFENFSQEIRKNFISISLIISLDLFIILYSLSIINKLSFLIPFRKLIVFIIITLLFMNLIFIERPMVLKNFNLYQNYILLIPIFIDSILIFLSTLFFFYNYKWSHLKSFLDFYFVKKFDFTKRLYQLITILRDLFIISLIGILIVNIFLLPIFYAQIILKLAFHFLVLFFIFLMIIFYIVSYYKVSKIREENPEISYSISFLGFRILMNLYQSILLIIFILIVGLIISFLIFYNLNLLENLNIIPKNTTL